MRFKYQDGETTINLVSNDQETKFLVVKETRRAIVSEDIYHDRDQAINAYNRAVEIETDAYRFIPKHTSNIPFLMPGARC